MVLEHDSEPLNKPGVITAVNTEEKYTVKMRHNFKKISVAGSNMKRMEPQKDKEIIVISGPFKEQKGQLYELDNEDGIVKFPDNLEILDLWRLCPFGGDRDEREHPTRAEREYLESVEPVNSGLQLGLSHEIQTPENSPIDIHFAAESVIESMYGRTCPDRMDKECAFMKPLGLQFTQVYGHAHVRCLIPGSQADRLMNFCPRLMLIAISGVAVAAMKYDDIVELVRDADRSVTLSLDATILAAVWSTGMSAACRVEDHQVVLPRSKAARHACPLSNWFGPSHRFPLGSIRHNVPFPGGRRYLSVR